MTTKPNPDELLELIQKQESSQSKGKLKIFFGMCAGVGKTYAMLDEAQRKQKDGVQVLVGIVNTHGRKETEELLKGLTILPQMRIPYRGAIFEEFDLDTVLELKPQLILIDELAHTNVPGSRHRKRWQDVEEILDAGVDVYTTLNVQHIESRKGLIESIADVTIRETVPDSILERANAVSIIDVPPNELLQRLKDGKVYTGELSKIAIDHFFKEDNLTALREIALRLTAEKVEHDLHGLLALGGRGWRTREKLLVAINASPESEELIRSTRKKAFEMDAPWICLYVDTDTPLNEVEQEKLTKSLNLARDLGAEVMNIQDVNIASAIANVAKQKDVTQVILGRSPERGFFGKLFSSDIANAIEKKNKNVDVLILRQNRLQSLYDKIFPKYLPKKDFFSYLPGYSYAFLTVALMTLLGKLLEPWFGLNFIGLLFLGGIVFLSFFVGIWEILFAVVLSTLSGGFIFENTNFHDKIYLCFFFLVASGIGFLLTRLRRQELYLRERENALNRMIEIERQMGSAKDLEDLKVRLIPKLMTNISGDFDILTKNNWESNLQILQNPNEQAIANWVLQNGKIAGYSTNTLSSAQAIYYPIKCNTKTLGVLVYQPSLNHVMHQNELDFLQNVTSRLGVFLDRFESIDDQKAVDFSSQLEKLHHGILHSVSRSFYIPLEKIFDSVYKIQTSQMDDAVQEMFEQTANSANDLKNIIENIVTISELESGRVPFEIGNYDFYELISNCRIELFSIIDNHEFILNFPQTLPLLPFDFRLMKIAIKNLLINALEHSPPKTPITISLSIQEKTYTISISDIGPGIPDDLVPLIFNKFYQTPNSQSKGIGIGLAIVKMVIDLHDGSIMISTNKPQGTKFTIILPL